ncbi:hypothetical protein LSUE1_G009416 [Lachnellula suecica]|uniref:SMP-30/Gluconolactonase/LRE-like region domain-containing protein n=1 Tax=Lachnellula suecica TaxID=602035 RepID=A0A8T9C329_9HELO|nr:hypothetical protein LSUE1_G009416 [Lachnellula suecica]
MRFLSLLVGMLPLASGAVISRQTTSTIFKFSSPGVSAENIAIRPSGQLLVTFMDAAQLYSIDPSTKTGTKLVTFPGFTSTAGITEVSPDVFAVVAGNYSGSGGNKAGSWAIWKVDLTGAAPKTEVVKRFADSTMFNGLTTLNNDTVLIGEGKGSVIRLSISNGSSSTAIQDASMAPPSSAPIPLGIDGVRYFNGTVYFTNIFKNTFSKVPVDATGKATGAVVPIWTNNLGDDFTFGADGSAYVAGSGKLLKVTADGKVSTAATISSPTSCAFGRGSADKGILYVTSSGSVVSVPISS